MKKLSLAESDFPRIIGENFIYVDKTREIYDLINYSRYVFLSRPRRFGKSLLISTLEALFQGKKELFKGLWIEDKIEWEEYPVIRIDFGDMDYDSLDDFKEDVDALIEGYAREYEITLREKAPTMEDFELGDLQCEWAIIGEFIPIIRGSRFSGGFWF